MLRRRTKPSLFIFIFSLLTLCAPYTGFVLRRALPYKVKSESVSVGIDIKGGEKSCSEIRAVLHTALGQIRFLVKRQTSLRSTTKRSIVSLLCFSSQSFEPWLWLWCSAGQNIILTQSICHAACHLLSFVHGQSSDLLH